MHNSMRPVTVISPLAKTTTESITFQFSSSGQSAVSPHSSTVCL